MTHPSDVFALAIASAIDPHAHAMEPPSIGFVAPEVHAEWLPVLIGAFGLALVAAFSPVIQFLFQRKRRAPVHPFRFGSAKVLCGRDVK